MNQFKNGQWADNYGFIAEHAASGLWVFTCGRCAGKGTLEHYGHVYGGTCYKCKGSGVDASRMPKGRKGFGNREEILAVAAKRVEARAKRDAKADAKRLAELPEILARLEAENTRQAALAAAKEAFTFVDAAVGDKVTFTGVVKVATKVENDFGVQKLVIVETVEAQQFKFVSTAQWVWDIEAGQTLTVIATLKAFNEYNGTKQNVVKLPKLVA